MLQCCVLLSTSLSPPCNNLAVDQEPAGPQFYLMSMSQTTEPSKDGPTVTEGFIWFLYHFSNMNISVSLVLGQWGVCHR